MRTTTLIRAEEFQRIAEVLGPCELSKGEVVRMSPGGVRHSQLTWRVAFALERQNAASPSGQVLVGKAGMIIARYPDTVRGADVAFISFDRLPADAKPGGFLTVPPELVVEVLSDDASWTEIETKIAEYHSFGVDTVWVLDPRMLAVRVYPRGGEPVTLHGEDELTSAHPAGFRCLVNELFA